MSDQRPGEIRIGETLEAARSAASLDLAAVEERTKVRARYLRALEAERWDELPSSSYAKGFLRTYAELLGLDAEMLVDEYRRQVEGGEAPPTPGGGRPRMGLLVGAGAAVALAAVVVIALTAGDDEPDQADPGAADQPRNGGRGGGDGGKGATPAAGTVELALKIREPVEVCLLGGGGEALIDGQVLPAGSREQFKRKRFELRFPAGFGADQLEVRVDGEPASLPRRDGPAAYSINPPARVRALGPPGMRCP